VKNNPLKYTDPTGHMVDPGGAWGGTRQDSPPWYAPAVIGAARIRDRLDGTVGKFGREIEVDRLARPIQLSLSGNPLRAEGFSMHYENPFMTLDTNLQLDTRVEWGDSSLPRVDQNKYTFRFGELSQLYSDWAGDEYGVVFKAPADSIDIGRGQSFGIKGKGAGAVGMASSLNPYMITKSTAEFAYGGTLAGEDLTVKAGPSLSNKVTLHGAPAALVLVPVATYFGLPQVIATLSSGGVIMSKPIPAY